MVPARIHNNIVNATQEVLLLPKAIVIVLDSDLVKTVSFEGDNAAREEIIEVMLRNLGSGIHKLLLAHKENLPAHSKRMGYPAVLWALTPLDKDFPQKWIQDRMIFNATLEKMVEKFQGINTLKLLKIWDPEDRSFYNDHRLTANGLQAIWFSIDSAFRHWDTFVSTKQKKKISIGKKPTIAVKR